MIYIASDHAGHRLKKELVQYLEKKMELKITDLGPTEFDQDDDYPDFAIAVANKVTDGKDNLGILICGTGHGMCITANKVPGIRAIVGYSILGTELGRQRNNANILCLAGKILSKDHAEAIVKKFIETEFQNNERDLKRDKKIQALER